MSDTTSGVPQRSVLGPLLFVLYINDSILLSLFSQLGVFADDTNMYSIIRSICDVVKLQKDLDNMQEWSRFWLLNLKKCKVMHIGKTFSTNCTMETSTTPRSVLQLNEVDFEKDLGVWTTSSLKVSLHCDKVAACAMKILGMLKRTFVKISKELFIFLYRTYGKTSPNVLCATLVSILS